MKYRYRTQLGRDLFWALRSPMLMESPRVVGPGWGMSETARYQGLLKELDQRRSALARSIRNSEATALGKYFEVLVRTWIEEVPPAQLAAANWQVYAGSQTIGEFDLLFDRDGQTWHWELAIKFYLGHPAPDGQFRWYGPNPRDRLDKKWAKMRGQQLRLGGHPAARGALQVLGVESSVNPQAFIKGYLFLPLSESFDVEYPPDINPNGLRGWWVHRSHFSEQGRRLTNAEELEWVILKELRWMSPAYITDEDRLFGLDALSSVVSEERATLVAGMAPGKGGLKEVTRGFVVPDGWPHLSPL